MENIPGFWKLLLLYRSCSWSVECLPALWKLFLVFWKLFVIYGSCFWSMEAVPGFWELFMIYGSSP